MNDTIGAHDGDANAIVTASLTPITMPATSGPSARAESAEHHRGEHDADPRVDLRRREREAQREADAGDARQRAADAGQQQRVRARVDAEGGGDRRVLGERAQRRPRSV